MKRSPLKRSPFKRKGAKPTDNPGHLKHLRTLPCALWNPVCAGFGCGGPIHSHHSTVNKGMSLRTSDLDAFPLCRNHHAQFHQHNGVFQWMTKSERKSWQLEMSERYRPKESA